MTMPENIELICIRLDVPHAVALGFNADPDGVGSRHHIENVLQQAFFDADLKSFIAEGSGTISAGLVYTTCASPVATLRALMPLLEKFPCGRSPTSLLPFVHVAWRDREGDGYIWRMFHPRATVRPFWTLLESPELIAALLAKGRALRAEREVSKTLNLKH